MLKFKSIVGDVIKCVAQYSKKILQLLYTLCCSIKYQKADIVTAFILFIIVLIFSIIMGQDFNINQKNYGKWHLYNLAPLALTHYNGQKVSHVGTLSKSNLSKFLYVTSRGKSDIQRITNAEANPKEYSLSNHNNLMIHFPFIIKLVSNWWHFIGYPSYQELHILLSIYYSLTVVVVYCLLRQVCGLLPSFFISLAWALMPLNIYYNLLWFRESSRNILVFSVLCMIFYFLKSKFTWKKNILGSVITGITLGVGCGLRGDYSYFFPFLIIVLFCFHGKKIFSCLNKKVAFIVLSFMIFISISCFMKVGYKGEHHGIEHVVYMGLYRPYVNKLLRPSGQYLMAGSSSYWDRSIFVTGSSIGYHRFNFNKVEPYSYEYGIAMQDELKNIVLNYPYDICLLGVSGIRGILHSSFNPPYVSMPRMVEPYSTPSYSTAKCFSMDLLSKIPPATGSITIILVLLITGLFNYRRFLLIFAMGLICLGLYASYYDPRHYSYLSIISLIGIGFLFSLLIRSIVIFSRNPSRVIQRLKFKKKKILIRLLLIPCPVIFISICIYILALYQDSNLKSRTEQLIEAPKTAINFTVNQNVKVAKGFSHIKFANLDKETIFKTKKPETLYAYCEYLVLEFDFSDAKDKKITDIKLFTESKDRYAAKNNRRGPFLFWNSFPVNFKDKYYFISPVYYCKDYYFDGMDIPTDKMKYLKKAYILNNPKEMYLNDVLWLPLNTSLDYKLRSRFIGGL